MEPKSGEFWWVRLKLTPPLIPVPYNKGEIRLAKISRGPMHMIIRLIDEINGGYVHEKHVEFIEQVKKPEPKDED